MQKTNLVAGMVDLVLELVSSFSSSEITLNEKPTRFRKKNKFVWESECGGRVLHTEYIHLFNCNNYVSLGCFAVAN